MLATYQKIVEAGCISANTLECVLLIQEACMCSWVLHVSRWGI